MRCSSLVPVRKGWFAAQAISWFIKKSEKIFSLQIDGKVGIELYAGLLNNLNFKQ